MLINCQNHMQPCSQFHKTLLISSSIHINNVPRRARLQRSELKNFKLNGAERVVNNHELISCP
jgi:hypothetical protein